MVFWRWTGQSKLKQMSHLIERCYLQDTCGFSCHYTAPITLTKHSSLTGLQRRDKLGFCSNMRFFAAPVQAKPKQEEKEQSGRHINEQIEAKEVRVVTDEGHYIVPLHKALQEARRLKLDLVEVQRDANPPVVKIMDFHMERYKQQLHGKERAKAKGKLTVKQGVLKEVRFTIKTEPKDLVVKANGIKRLMDRGYRVKCMATGSEDQDLGGLLARMVALIEDVAHVDSGPTVEKRQAFVIVRHVKFGPTKGGGKKKVDLSAEIQQQQTTVGQSGDSTLIPEEEVSESCFDETEEEIFPDEDEKPKKVGIEWSMDGAEYDSTKVLYPRSNSNLSSDSDFQRPTQLQIDGAPKQQVTENRYARKTEQGRRFPLRSLVDNYNSGRVSRDTFRLNPHERMQMPSDMQSQDRVNPNFSRNSKVPAGEIQKPGTQRPDGLSPREAGQSFGIFSPPRSNASNNQR